MSFMWHSQVLMISPQDTMLGHQNLQKKRFEKLLIQFVSNFTIKEFARTNLLTTNSSANQCVNMITSLFHHVLQLHAKKNLHLQAA